MPMPALESPCPLIAVDVGNSRIKLGLFDRAASAALLPEPQELLELPLSHRTGRFDSKPFQAWCDRHLSAAADWYVGSVRSGAAEQFAAAVAQAAKSARCDWHPRHLTNRDLPVEIQVEAPERIGIDRLLAALAANAIKSHNRAAIVVDLGTAITVDLVTEAGAFAGGAILPGLAMAARALHEQTDRLPLVDVDKWDPLPPPVGKATEPAIQAGLFWGTVGAIRELVDRLSTGLAEPPQLLVSGGASAAVLGQLHSTARLEIRHLPHLVLSGIALLDRCEQTSSRTVR
jgi:type III pantothenate kinase